MAKSIVGKLPYMQLYPTDIIADTRLLSLEARGAWYDFLMFAWNAPERGSITMPLSGWGRMWGISAERAGEIIAEIDQLGVGDVNIKNDACNAGNDFVTLTNRRMKRECNAREKSRKRVEKHRVTKTDEEVKRECNANGNADVTPYVRAKPETRDQKPEKNIYKKSESSEPLVIPPELEALAFKVLGAIEVQLSEWIKLYPPNWIKAALLAADERNKKSVAYVRAILQNYQKSGEPNDSKTTQRQSRQNQKPGTNLETGNQQLEGL